MPDFAVTTAFRATDRMSPAFRRMSGEADRFGQHGSRAMGRVGRAAQVARGLISSMLPIAGGFALIGLANRAVELASSLNEVQNVVDVTFGSNAQQINRWSQTTITAFGLSELQAKQFTSQIGAMMKSSGIAGQELVTMSTGLAGLAGDFASFYNLDIAEAFDKIRAGIAGETEPLRRLGINMSVANLQAFALSRGIRRSWASMSSAEQTQLRYAFLMERSADAQGDFNRTLATSFANQKRVLGVKFDQALARLATAVMPSLLSLFTNLNRILDVMPLETIGRGLSIIAAIAPYIAAGFVAWKVAIFGVAAAHVAMNIAGWIRYLWMMRAPIMMAVRMTKAWRIAQWALNVAMLANPIGLIILLIAALAIAVTVMIKKWHSFGAAMSIGFGPLGEVVSQFRTLYDWWDRIKNAFNVGGMISALYQFRSAMGDAMLYPLQQLLELIQRIPGIGGLARDAAQNIRGFRENQLNAPNAAQQGNTSFEGTLNINNAPQGSTAQGQTRGPGSFDLALMGAN